MAKRLGGRCYQAVAPARRQCGWRSADSWAMTAHLLVRLDARDRALMLRCAITPTASRLALATLVASHLAVQLVKRTVVRARPGESGVHAPVVAEPDRFSFPSGHAAASMSVALGYGVTFPVLALPLLVLALLVGFSRVRLGVHFPGDVLAGQVLALLTAGGVLALT